MELLFKRSDVFIKGVPMDYIRTIDQDICWTDRLLAIKGPKGVGKSTLMLQHIRRNFEMSDRSA